MVEEKKSKRGKKKTKRIEDTLGMELSDVKVGSELAKMTVEEAVKQEGILPINPVDIADDETSEKIGREAGMIWGASIYTLIKAFTRNDLPVSKRIRLGMKGSRPIISAFIQGIETAARLSKIENSILTEAREIPTKNTPTAHDVIAELKNRIEALEKENEALKKRIS